MYIFKTHFCTVYQTLAKSGHIFCKIILPITVFFVILQTDKLY